MKKILQSLGELVKLSFTSIEEINSVPGTTLTSVSEGMPEEKVSPDAALLQDNEKKAVALELAGRFLSLREVASTDLVSKAVKARNESNWYPLLEKYFGEKAIKKGASARATYIEKAKAQEYYVIGEQINTKQMIDPLNFFAPNPNTSFPKTSTLTIFASLEEAKKKQSQLNSDIYSTDTSDYYYYAPQHFLFAVKCRNQKAMLAPDTSVEVPTESVQKDHRLIKQ